MLPAWAAQTGLKFWSCNRLLCFNTILSLGRAEISAWAENSPCNNNNNNNNILDFYSAHIQKFKALYK
jgi:hypothetical protein